MTFKPWDCAQPDEWLPRSLRLCWGGSGDGSGDSSSSSGWSDSGATTGPGDWGSSGTYDASSFNATGDVNAWAGTAYDASTAGTGAGAAGDWSSFGPTNYSGMNAPNPIFTDIAGPNPGVTTGAGDWGSAGTFSAAGTGGGPAGAMVGAVTGAGVGNMYGGVPGGLFGDYGPSGPSYGGGGPSYGGGGGRGAGGGPFGSIGTLAASNTGRGSERSASEPTFTDTAGSAGGRSAGPSSSGRITSDAPTRSEATIASVTPSTDPDSDPPADPDAAPLGTPTPSEPDTPAPEAVAGPSLSDAAPAGNIGGSRDASPASQASRASETLAAPNAFGPQSLNVDYQGAPYADMGPPSQAYTAATQALSNLTQTSLAPLQDSFDSRFSFDTTAPSPSIETYTPGGREPTNWDYGPNAQIAAPDFNQVFADLQSNIAPGWNPAEQMAGTRGLAEPTDWGGNPLAASTNVSVGRDFNQAFAPFSDTRSGMDLAGDQRSETEPALTFNEMWGSTPYNTLPNDQLSRSAQQTLEHDFSFYPNPGFVQGPPAPTWGDRFNTTMNAIINPAAMVTMYPFAKGLDALMAIPDPMANMANPFANVPDPATAWSNFAQNTLLGGPNIQALNPDAIAAQELGAQARAGQNYIMDTPFVSPTVPTQAIEVDLAPLQDVISPGQIQNVQHPEALPQSQDPGTLPPAVETPESGRPVATPESGRPEQPQQTEQAQPQEAQPVQPQEAQPVQPSAAPPQAPMPQSRPPAAPSLLDMQQPGTPMPQSRPSDAPQQPQTQPGADTEPDHDEEGEPPTNAPPDPGRPLGAPTTRTQNTPVNTPEVRQEQQGGTRNRPVSEALHGVLTQAARQAGVVVHVGSGGQVATRSRADYRQSGGWTGSIRHNHGNAADVRLEQNGRFLNYNNPQDRVVMENFVREAARLGATGMGAGMGYMGPNTIHVGFGAPAFWRTDNPGSRGLRQAYHEGRQGPANRPPADIPNVRTAQPGVPLPRARPSDAPQTEVAQPDVPPTQQPGRLPPQQEPPAPRPPADIPIDIPAPTLVPPVPAARTDRAAMQFARFLADNLAKTGKLPSNREEGQKALTDLAQELARAGYPANVAQRTILETATQGSIKAGHGPNSLSNTFGHVTQAINEMAATAMQGYHAGKAPEAQGPPAPAPAAPGKRSEFGSFVIPVAGGRDVGKLPSINPDDLNTAIENFRSQQLQPPGRAEWEAPLPGGSGANIDTNFGQLNPGSYPPAGPGDFAGQSNLSRDPSTLAPYWSPAPAGPAFKGQGSPYQFDFEADPGADQHASLFDFLSNFNPISTAEARGGRSQNLMDPRADPGTIQGRLVSARSDIINELQTNQGLRNTLDLIVTGEVGGQGKAAVRGFLETAMNKVAAEASREGRTPTGRDLLNYLNNRSYFPDTWGKIESGKVKGGALTDDLLGEIAAGSNTTQLSTGNSSAKSAGSRFGGNPTNATIGKEHYGVESYAHHAAWYNAMGALPSGRGIGSDYAAGPYDGTAVGAMPAQDAAPGMRGLAEGGHVAEDEKVVVGERGPEYFVPDWSRPAFHVPNLFSKGAGDRHWPKMPAVDYPGRYGDVEREIRRQTRAAQDPVPNLMDMIDSGRLRLTPNWKRMMTDPDLIALGRSRIEDRRAYSYDYPY